jgi:hypothetical protein
MIKSYGLGLGTRQCGDRVTQNRQFLRSVQGVIKLMQQPRNAIGVNVL